MRRINDPNYTAMARFMGRASPAALKAVRAELEYMNTVIEGNSSMTDMVYNMLLDPTHYKDDRYTDWDWALMKEVFADDPRTTD